MTLSKTEQRARGLLCRNCGKPAVNGTKRCAEHLAANVEYQRRRRAGGAGGVDFYPGDRVRVPKWGDLHGSPPLLSRLPIQQEIGVILSHNLHDPGVYSVNFGGKYGVLQVRSAEMVKVQDA